MRDLFLDRCGEDAAAFVAGMCVNGFFFDGRRAPSKKEQGSRELPERIDELIELTRGRLSQ